MARGKVGDVVFYRMNGWQMSRVRNRKPKNPRTPEQMYQRAIIATVMKSYSAGKEIFDHSFQDYRFGEDNMRRFNSINAIYLRNLIKQEVTNGTDETESNVRVVGPKSPSCVPNFGFTISEGTLVNNFMVVNTGTGDSDETKFTVKMPPVEEDETLQHYFNRLGIYNDDIFTIVAFMPTDDVVSSVEGIMSPYSKQLQTNFAWLRIKMTGDLEQTKLASETSLSEIITIESNNNGLVYGFGNLKVGGVITANFLMNTTAKFRGTMAVIRSKNNSNLRSTEQLKWINVTNNYKAYGITTEWILDAWMKEKDTIGQSELILEGGEPYELMNELSDEIEVEKLESESSKKRKK